LGPEGKFSYIIDLQIEDAEILRRTVGLLNNPKFGSTYSKTQLAERNKPKPVSEDDVEEQEEEEGEVDKGPIEISALVMRANDVEKTIKQELEYYQKKEVSPLEALYTGLLSQQILKVDSAGLLQEQIQACISAHLRQDRGIPLRPIARKIEEGGGFKDLLTAEQAEGDLPRQWSLWKQTDPVALFSGKVQQG